MNVLDIRLSEIDRSDAERIRPVDPAYAQMFSEEIRDNGQLTPIEVREVSRKGFKYALISGGHRCAALTLLGHETVRAIVIACTADEAILREIDENLIRRDLTLLAKARSLAERQRIYRKLHPQIRHGGL